MNESLRRKTDQERLTSLEVEKKYVERAVEDIKYTLQRIEEKFDKRMNGMDEKVDDLQHDMTDMKARFKGGYWVIGALGAIAVGLATIIRALWNQW